MTATIEETEIDWSVLEDIAVPCESIQGCDNTAAWKATFVCCGGTHLICTPCKETVKLQLELIEFNGNSIICRACRTKHKSPIDAIILTPLG